MRMTGRKVIAMTAVISPAMSGTALAGWQPDGIAESYLF